MQEKKLRENLEILREVREETGCHILLAQKAFSMYHVYPLIGEYLDGATASGLHEARLGYEEMGKENHIFSPAYKEEEIQEILRLCDHIVFNSPAQFRKYKDQVRACDAGMTVKGILWLQEICMASALAAGAWGFGSIRSAPHRKGTRSMIPALRFQDWERLWSRCRQS